MRCRSCSLSASLVVFLSLFSQAALFSQQPGNSQMGEQVLPVQQAAADAPKKRGPDHPWVELSNLKKGNDGPFPTLQVDYKVTAGNAGDFTLVIKSERGRSTVHVVLFGDKQSTISVRNFAFQGFPDNCEVWAETGGGFSPFDRTVGYKISKSVTLGNVGQITLARDWRPEEATAYAHQQKMIAPPPPAPSGSVVVDARTAPLLPGMPVLGTWMAEWHEGELVAISPQLLTIKWAKPLDRRPEISSMARSRVAVATATLDKGRTAPGTFRPSVQVLEGGTKPLEGGLVPLTADIALVPGTPLKAEWGNRFETVTVSSETQGEDIPVLWDDHRSRKENRKRGTLAIEQKTLERLKQADATAFYAARLEKLERSAASRPRSPAHNYTIRLPLPRDAALLEEDLFVPKGTKLQAEWGGKWHPLRVLSDSEEGPVECNWVDFGSGNWNEWINRGSLVITSGEKSRLAGRSGGEAATGEKKGETKPAVAASPMKPIPAAGAPAGSGGGKFEIVLEEMPANKKVSVAKAAMKIAGLELKDALQLVDALPISLKGSLSEAEARAFQKQIEAAGGKASVKPE